MPNKFLPGVDSLKRRRIPLRILRRNRISFQEKKKKKRRKRKRNVLRSVRTYSTTVMKNIWMKRHR